MIKAAFWKRDWVLGLAVALAMLLLGGSDFIQSIERKAYDAGVRASDRAPSDRIAVIAIDDASIRSIGRWPWPRDVHAKFADLLAAGKPKVIGSLVFFSEPQIDPGLVYINKLSGLFRQLGPGASANPSAPLGQMGSLLTEAESALNTDRKLADSYARAGNVLLPMFFEFGEPLGKADQPLPTFVARNELSAVQGSPDDLPLSTLPTVTYPTETIGSAAAGIGHLTTHLDIDGAVRTEPLVLQHFDQLYPSLAMLIAAKSLNLGNEDIQVRLGEGVSLGKLRITTDPQLQMRTFFYKSRDGKPPFAVDSFFDVYSGKIAPERYRDKIVLVGPTAAGVGTSLVTPVSEAMPPVLVLANTVSSILQEHFFVVPRWALWVELAAYLAAALFLIVAVPRLKAGPAAGATLAFVVALIAVEFGMMIGRGTWLQLMLPVLLLIVGYGLLTTKRYLVTEAGKIKSDQDSAASNRMLGLAFQGQGQLDMAFDYFRKCPVDDVLLDNVYNLALDFERKRQFNKAESAFRYIADHNPKFRDLETRLARAKQLSETVILGGGGGTRTNAGLTIGDNIEKPMLGRYQVERELGRGAMGAVYLGRDPKIGRVVAIKTMALSQEFEADELAEVKERFFREAETAGRLNHQNIVTIFDAGEEHDLAYIAMEFLKGKDLAGHTKAPNLLPLDRAVSIVARVADALGYAHKQNVVHRDIKPANIMYEPESDTVKVTDFGIARITDSSKTKTGMVLGTPSYMSPEQLAGRKVDGRSDLFSLAVTLFQFASGKLPFEGDSMAQLMFKIANEPAPDVLTINPGLPPTLAVFLEQALAKEADARFQTGEEFAAALRAIFPGGGSSQPDVDIAI